MRLYFKNKWFLSLFVSVLIFCTLPSPAIYANTDQQLPISKPNPIHGEYVEGTVLVTLISPQKTTLTREGQVSFDDEISVEKSYCFRDASHLATTAEQEAFLIDKTIYLSEVTSDSYSTSEMIDKLDNKAYVVNVEPDYIQHLTTTDDPQSEEQWYLDGEGSFSGTTAGISYSSSKGKTKTGEPVVAVIDTGIDAKHEDLREHMWENPIADLGPIGSHGYDFITNTATSVDSNGHGTHCAGVISASTDNQTGIAGISSNAKLMSLRIFDNNGETKNSSIIGAFNYILQAKKSGVNITAVNCSWGGAFSSQQMAELVHLIGESGVLFIFAAGNDGTNHDLMAPTCPYDLYTGNEHFAIQGYADNRNYIVITGCSDTNDAPTSYSDYGNADVDLFAPGDRILSTYIEDTYFPGTYTENQEKQLTASLFSFDDASDINRIYTEEELGISSETDADLSYTEKDYRESETSGCVSWFIDWQSSPFGEEKSSYLYLDVDDLNLNPEDTYYVSALLGVTDSNGFFTWQHVIKKSSGEYGSTNNRFYEAEDGTLYFKILGIIAAARVTSSVQYYLDDIGISTANPDTSLFGQYDIMNGTSMAAPMVAGATALLSEIYPTDDVINRKNRLMTCTRTNLATSGKCISGGVLDLSKMDSYTPVVTPPEETPPTPVPSDTSITVNQVSLSSTATKTYTVTQKTVSKKTKKIIKTKKIKLKKSKATLKAGQKLKLKVVVRPSNATNKKVKWTSSQKKWAAVTQKGLVTAKKKGRGHTVKITAKARDGSGKKAVCKIQIKK